MVQRRDQSSAMAFMTDGTGKTAAEAVAGSPLANLQEALAAGQVDLPAAVDVQTWRAGLLKDE